MFVNIRLFLEADISHGLRGTVEGESQVLPLRSRGKDVTGGAAFKHLVVERVKKTPTDRNKKKKVPFDRVEHSIRNAWYELKKISAVFFPPFEWVFSFLTCTQLCYCVLDSCLLSPPLSFNFFVFLFGSSGC